MTTMGSARILIVEEDITLSDQLADLLRGRGFNITRCTDGEQGLMEAIKNKFELILLDVMLPSMDGFSVLKNLRKTRQTPVMLLMPCAAEEDRIRGYSLGADDCLSKPLNFTELGLRIDALLRRSLGLKGCRNQNTELVAGGLRLNRLKQIALFDGQPITLTPLQFKLLWVLVDSQNDVLTKPYLYQLVLERAFSKYDRSLDMHLSRVRRKLVDAGMAADRLSTVHGKGYCFL